MSSTAIQGNLGGASGGITAIGRADPITSKRNLWIDSQMSTPAIANNTVSGFKCATNATTKGVDVSFSLTDVKGVGSLSLLRAAVLDISQATVLQTWTASVSGFTWSDTDAVLQTVGQVYYWIKLEPSSSTGTETVNGPQILLLNPSLYTPTAATGISASHAAAVNGAVLVTCNIAGIPSGDSCKVYVTGYEGNATAVAVAQKSSTPIQFNLEATSETVILKAVTVSPGGAEAASGPTCTLVLNGTATVPAKPEGVTVAQIATGNQVMWPASAETGVTGYQLWRGNRGTGFGASSLLATVAATGEGTVQYLDTGGLGGDYEYFVIAVATGGNSTNSDAANPQIIYSSALIPTNVGSNTTNSAFLDSIDAGTSATLRIYGSGGPGTSYLRKMGYGSVTRASGSITGLGYSTTYYVIFNTNTQTYLSSTTYSDSLPDGYEWVGVMMTVASGGGGGGGGGGTGASGNAIMGGGTVAAVNISNGGYGYGSATVSFSGGGGGGAAGTVVCSVGSIIAVRMTNNGAGYGSPPAVNFTSTSAYYGGGGNTNGGARYVVTS